MIIAITGASGFIGRALSDHLRARGHEVRVVRLRERQAVPACDAVVHLAGEPVAQRWTAEARRRITSSRIEGTRRLIDEMGGLSTPPRVVVSASAVGYYGSRGDELLAEASPPGTGFLAELVTKWEREARRATAFGARVVTPRLGVVLGRGGGALERMLPVFRLGVGGRLGSGRQWMSWIHLEDLLSVLEFALAQELVEGPLNATAPHPVTNAEFTRELGRVLGRPAFAVVPGFALRLACGDMASVLLDSQRAAPQTLLDHGFRFRFPELGPALKDLLG